MAGQLRRIYGIKPSRSSSTTTLLDQALAEQRAALAETNRTLAAQEATLNTGAAADAASGRARGLTGRALLLNDEIGLTGKLGG